MTSKHWPQREAFLDALREAIREGTFANGTYYPGSDEIAAEFNLFEEIRKKKDGEARDEH